MAELELVYGVEGYAAPLCQSPQGERPLHPKLPKSVPIYLEAHPHIPIIYLLYTYVYSEVRANMDIGTHWKGEFCNRDHFSCTHQNPVDMSNRR
jgi:hypothetical protein